MLTLAQYEGSWVAEAALQSGRLEWIKNLEVRPDDVFIAGFPKSGVTWSIEITYLLMNGVDISKARSQNQDKRVPYIEYGDQETVTDVIQLPSPRLLKTHLPYHLLPTQLKEKNNKIVYIFRNAKDVSVSLFHFMKFMKAFNFDGNFEEFLPNFIKGKVLDGPWWEHVKSFWKHKNDDNILLLTYEDLRTTPDSEIRRIATFLDKELSDDQLARIKQYCSFDSMKYNDKANFSHLVKDNKMTAERKEVGLVRKGIVGDWRNYFNEEMREEMDRLVKENLDPLGLHFDDETATWEFIA